YYYQVTAVNAGGESAKSSEVSARPQVTAPVAPTNLVAAVGNAQVTLTWTASSGATSYNIYRSTTPGGEGSTPVQTGVSSASFINSGLTNGTTYYYQVTAVNAGGESAKSSETSATPQVPAPAAPTNFTATAGNTQVTLTWTASSGATSYNIYRSTTPGGEGSTPLQTGVAITSFTNTGLTNGTTYYYQVTAVNAGGESTKSSEVSAAPTAPSGPAAAAYNFDQASGSSLTDLSGNNNTGTLQNSPVWSTGTHGGALNFNGNNQYVEMPNSASLDISGTNLTLSLWINLSDYGTDEVIVSKPWLPTSYGGANYQYAIEYTHATQSVTFFYGDTSAVKHTFSMPVALNAWAYVAFTYDGSTAKGYMNGVQQFSTATSGSIQARGNPLRLGIDPTLGQDFQGSMDDLRIYNQTLSASQIQADMNTPVVGTVSAPASPTNLTATAGNAQVTLTWTASSGATSYNIYRSTAPGGEGATPLVSGVTSTSFTNTGLTNGTTYYYQVTAVNSGGESVKTSEVSARPQVSAPAAPTNLTATPASTQVTLTWTASSGATSYNIYRSTTPGGEGSTPVQTGITSTSFTNTGLTNGTTYYYQVTAVNAGGESAKSSEVSATPRLKAPTAPANLSASAGNAQVTLTWTPSSGATSYSIYRSTSPGGKGATLVRTGVTSTSFTNTGLTNGTMYFFQVTAVNSAGQSPMSSAVSAMPQAPTPATPTNFAATAGNAQVTLTWTASSGATSYNIYRSTTPGGEGSTPYLIGVVGTSFTDTGLTNGVTYYYQVTAVNANGQSAKSGEVFAKPGSHRR
ncbi:MAG: fibronectin type III domain-containing protein, partial [Planctomycetes bacterium]|nr:fibronectin type III domain-containing protein [Planctomycetota bacterium]